MAALPNNIVQTQLYTLFRQFISDMMFPTIGFVYDIDCDNLRADVEIEMPNSFNKHLFEKVPIQIGARGVSQSGPFKGDRVLLNFVNGSIHSPIVVAVLDYEHKESTRVEQTKHERKGVYVPDYIANRQDWPIEDNDWEEDLDWGQGGGGPE